ncbi:hypothetical protein RHMOL_Rhmol03G0144100 [Rhododendron molle]|uniref:Uncharacterized protein n=1 Tax=Rhododendron molle TaxID=49168 RepID=A0ACC0PFI2_RHOML|nr:hypothetical protein RHMOL_Rhmol03G0144100 [Rhododendron molle]
MLKEVVGGDGLVVRGGSRDEDEWQEVVDGVERARPSASRSYAPSCSFSLRFWMAFDGCQVKKMGQVLVCSIVGLVLGLLVFISTMVTAAKGYAGAGTNPARCFGPVVVRGGHPWDGHWIFWVGPALALRKALASAESNQNSVNGIQHASSSEDMDSINFLV